MKLELVDGGGNGGLDGNLLRLILLFLLLLLTFGALLKF
jgi:hypothetical protein